MVSNSFSYITKPVVEFTVTDLATIISGALWYLDANKIIEW